MNEQMSVAIIVNLVPDFSPEGHLVYKEQSDYINGSTLVVKSLEPKVTKLE